MKSEHIVFGKYQPWMDSNHDIILMLALSRFFQLKGFHHLSCYDPATCTRESWRGRGDGRVI